MSSAPQSGPMSFTSIGADVAKTTIYRNSGSVVSNSFVDLEKEQEERSIRANLRASLRKKSWVNLPSLPSLSNQKRQSTMVPVARVRGNLRNPVEVHNQREDAMSQLKSAFYIFDERQSGYLNPVQVLALLRCMLPDQGDNFTERDALDFIAESERSGEAATLLSFDGFVKGIVNLTRGGPNERMSDNQDYHPLDPDEAMDAAEAVVNAVEAQAALVRAQPSIFSFLEDDQPDDDKTISDETSVSA